MAQRRNGATAQTTFAKASVVKGHNGAKAQRNNGAMAQRMEGLWISHTK
jgi:hypothetical protein